MGWQAATPPPHPWWHVPATATTATAPTTATAVATGRPLAAAAALPPRPRRRRRPAAAAVAVAAAAAAVGVAAALSAAALRRGGGRPSRPAAAHPLLPTATGGGGSGGRLLASAAASVPAPTPRAPRSQSPPSRLRAGGARALALASDGDSRGGGCCGGHGNDTAPGGRSRPPAGGRPTIYDVLFAGTHDSGAYAVDVARPARGAHPALAAALALAPTAGVASALLAAPLGAMTVTQGAGGVGAQLAAGARFLDLRVGRLAGTAAGQGGDRRPWWRGLGGAARAARAGAAAAGRPLTVDDYWLVHGMVACAPLADALAAVNAYHAAARAASPGGGGVTLVLSVTLEWLDAAEVDALAGVLLDGLADEVWRGGAASLRGIAYEGRGRRGEEWGSVGQMGGGVSGW